MSRPDPHSRYDESQPRIVEVALTLRIDFAARRLDGEAWLQLAGPSAGLLDVDTRDLQIRGVTDGDGEPIAHVLGVADPILGAPLSMTLPPGTRAVRISYRTSPSSTALHWVEAGRTAGGAAPFVYSQCQPHHARSLAPLCDSPAARVRLRAELTFPAGVEAVMAASFVGGERRGDERVARFTVEEPIPPYLIALAAGALESREIGPRSRVWADPALVDAAASEFADVEQMILAAERLCGPYPWGRFDLAVMPAAFPHGGMENPRLAFISPSLIAGDRSLAAVVAHELAHAWAGNLTGCASLEHLWINEGFAVYVERRVLEEIAGAEAAALAAALGRRDLAAALHDLRGRPELGRLRPRLEGVSPEDAASVVPYEKGFLLLSALEAAVGRPRFDAFLVEYFAAHRFRSITTEELWAFAAPRLGDALARVDAARWLDDPLVPEGAPEPASARAREIAALGDALPDEKLAAGRAPLEWRFYLESLSRPAPLAVCEALDARFHLGDSPNLEIAVAWLTVAIEAGHAPSLQRVEAIVGETGRIKFLRPLYAALARGAATRELAGALFRRMRDRYHPAARHAVDTILRLHGVATQDVNPLGLRRR